MRRVLVLGPLLLGALAVPEAGLAWSWPVEGEVLRGFSLGSNPYAGGQHRGIDVAAVEGELVVAPTGGQVTFAGFVPSRGKSVTILTATGLSVTLSHLGELSVAKGRPIEEGAVLARAGSSGTQDHPVPYVQLGIRDASDPNGYRDPMTFLPPRAEAAPAPQEADPGAETTVAGEEAVDPSTSTTVAHADPGPAPEEPVPDAGSVEPSIPPAPGPDDVATVDAAGLDAGPAEPGGVAPPEVVDRGDRSPATSPLLQGTATVVRAAGPEPVVDVPAAAAPVGGGVGRASPGRGESDGPAGTAQRGATRSTVSGMPPSGRPSAATETALAAEGSRPARTAGRVSTTAGGANAGSRDDHTLASRGGPVASATAVTARPASAGIGGVATPALALVVLIALLTTASAVVRRGRTIERDGALLRREQPVLRGDALWLERRRRSLTTGGSQRSMSTASCSAMRWEGAS